MYMEPDSMPAVGPGGCLMQEFSRMVLSSLEYAEAHMGEEVQRIQFMPIWEFLQFI